MKFILLLVGLYLFYRYFLRQPKIITHPPSNTASTFGSQQEPDLFIDHEEVKKEHEKNQ